MTPTHRARMFRPVIPPLGGGQIRADPQEEYLLSLCAHVVKEGHSQWAFLFLLYWG